MWMSVHQLQDEAPVCCFGRINDLIPAFAQRINCAARQTSVFSPQSVVPQLVWTSELCLRWQRQTQHINRRQNLEKLCVSFHSHRRSPGFVIPPGRPLVIPVQAFLPVMDKTQPYRMVGKTLQAERATKSSRYPILVHSYGPIVTGPLSFHCGRESIPLTMSCQEVTFATIDFGRGGGEGTQPFPECLWFSNNRVEEIDSLRHVPTRLWIPFIPNRVSRGPPINRFRLVHC